MKFEQRKVCKKCKKCSAKDSVPYQQELRTKSKKNWLKYLLGNVKIRAKQKQLEYDLDLNWALDNCPEYCPIFGTPLIVGSEDIYKKISLRRKDLSEGFTKDNCEIVSLAATSNYLKNTYPKYLKS